jgi:ketosteroid isomerase-like protein
LVLGYGQLSLLEHSTKLTMGEFKMRKLLLVSVAVIVVFGHAAAQELNTIQAHNDRFAAALKSGDMETIGQTYAEDARIFPPGAEMIEGREAIQGYWKSAADTLADAKLTAVEVKPLSDNYAREIGTFSLKTKGENPQEIAGKYIVIWQKVGDDWKISDDIWNMNK